MFEDWRDTSNGLLVSVLPECLEPSLAELQDGVGSVRHDDIIVRSITNVICERDKLYHVCVSRFRHGLLCKDR